MLTIDVKEEVDSEWNNRLIKSELATIYQTREWGILLSEMGKKPLFLEFINEQGNVVAQLLLSVSNPSTKNLRNVIKKIFRRSIITWAYGPIIFNPKLINDVYYSLSKFSYLKKYKILGYQHPLSNHDLSKLDYLSVEQWATFLIDLNQPLEVLYAKIDNHSGRKNIERSQKRGVIIEEITENNLEDYVNLLNQTSSLMGRKKISLEQMNRIWKFLKPLGYSGFLAKKNDTTLSGILFSFLNNFIIEAGVIRAEEDKNQKLYSQDLIKWKIIEWGVLNKMKYYNLAGFNPEPQSAKEKGIFRYKKKWGGIRTNYWIIRGLNK